MSRLLLGVIAMTLLSYDGAAAQQPSKEKVAAIIEQQKKLVKISRDGCIVDPQDDGTTIIVCGESEDNKSQRMGPGPINNDRIRRGEAISTTRAGERDNSQCNAVGGPYGCIKLPMNRMGGFGSVPPPAIPLEEVLRGLPEPDMIVQEGTNVDLPKAPE
jgi:hypothetical protein